MVGISRSYQRYALKNIPTMRWQDTHTKSNLDNYLDPRVAYIFEGLPYDRILRLVIGSRWTIVHPANWPRLIRHHTSLYGDPLEIRENEEIDVGLSKVREWWEKRGQYINPVLERFRREHRGRIDE